MNEDTRSMILLGALILAYGFVSAWANGWRPLPIQPPKVDAKMKFARAIRDALIAEENRGDQ